ncbi:hypothetical protein MPSEU_000809700 [Mayamaea pseudoterrestris]|nr:hypothetical protein MPSEU_000809700 [Mayamaea pseudoterrestris]
MRGIRRSRKLTCLIFIQFLIVSDAFVVTKVRRNVEISQFQFKNRNEHVPTRSSLSFGMTSIINPGNGKASLSLLVSTFVGVQMDRKIPGSGIVSTLCAATLVSGLKWAPSAHALYEASWSTFLPASLVFLLLSLSNKSLEGKLAPKSSTRASIKRLGVPFAIACLGSVIGCTCSFLAFSKIPTLALQMPSHDALLAASCLTASFIGGSVNFLATASALQSVRSTNSLATNTLLSSMATADVLVMAMYLTGLTACIKSQWLAKWFAGNESLPVTLAPNEATELTTVEASTEIIVPSRKATLGPFGTAATSIMVASGIVTLANRAEPVLSSFLPGTGCAIITLSTPLVQRLLLSTLMDASMLQKVTGRLFEYSFLLLFASMGMSTDVVAVLRNAPVCLGFSCLALLIHSLITLLGNKIYHQCVDSSVTLMDTLVASNAAIGGAATAAAFAGQGPNEQRKELIVAGTVWGVAGYAIGTTAGLTTYHLLKRLVL